MGASEPLPRHRDLHPEVLMAPRRIHARKRGAFDLRASGQAGRRRPRAIPRAEARARFAGHIGGACPTRRTGSLSAL